MGIIFFDLKNLKEKYSKFIFTIVCVIISLISHAQEKEKSSEIKTINGKKYYIHKVSKGQSLYAIAKIYDTDINIILAENDEAIDGLKNGQELKIPLPSQNNSVVKNIQLIDTSRYVYHKVEKKETIYSITKQHNITDKQLQEFNPEVATGLKPGQMLIVAVKQKAKENLPPPVEITETPFSKSKKNKYNVGLFLPFKFNESDLIDPNALSQNKSSFPQLQSLAVDFYLGFKRAADSLMEKDFEVNLQLYDLDDKDSIKPENICKSSDFKSLDLIIGPLFPSDFKTVSAYAKQASIPIVSPFTQQNKILYKNNLVSKVNPSQYTLLESLADYCVDSLKNNSAVFIINNGSLKEAPYVKAFKQHYIEKLYKSGYTEKDSVREVKGLAGFKSTYIPGKKNIVVLFSNNQVYLADFITQLAVYSDKKDIVLAGWQNATDFENIDQDYFNRLNYTFPAQSNLNNIKSYNNLIKQYQSDMSSDPSDYFFEGFDIAQYYLLNLKNTGPDFTLKLNELPFEGNFKRYNFFRPDAETGFENRGVYIFKYNNYKLQQIGWK